MDIKELVAEFIAGTRWEALPEAVQVQARRCVLDSLGATLSGALTRVSRIAGEYAARTWSGEEGTIILQGPRSGEGSQVAGRGPRPWA